MAKKKETKTTAGELTPSPQPPVSPTQEPLQSKAKPKGKKATTKLTKCSAKEASAEPAVKRGPGRPRKYEYEDHATDGRRVRQRAANAEAVKRGGWKQENRALNNMQLRFVDEYLKDFKQTAAAIRAGYSPNSAENMAWRMMRNPRIIKLLEEKATEARSNHKVAVTRTLAEYEKLAFFDPQDIFDEHGGMLPIHQWPHSCRAALLSIQTKEETDREGNVTGLVRTVRFSSRREALADIAKMAGMLTDNVNLNIYSPEGLFNREPPVIIDMTEYTPEQLVALTRSIMPSQAPVTVDITPEGDTDEDTTDA